MGKVGFSSVALFALVLVSGCFTVREPEYPQIAVPSIPAGKDMRVQIEGFDATITTYVPVYGYTTVTGYSGPCYGRHGHRHCGLTTTTVSTTDFVPQTSATSVFRVRAADALERAGCILQTTDPMYRIEVRFDGPFTEDGDGWATAGWMLLSIFTADYGAQNWSARLKVYDVKSGRLVHTSDFMQRYEAVVWGPIPIFSPGCSDKTSYNVMKSWCLTALTDLAVADAMKYISGVVK